MENKQNGEYGIIKNVGGATYFDGGYESFNDAVDAMMDECLRLPLQERVSLAKRHYCNDMGEDYMIAVGSYDEETGEAEESMSLFEAVLRMVLRVIDAGYAAEYTGENQISVNDPLDDPLYHITTPPRFVYFDNVGGHAVPFLASSRKFEDKVLKAMEEEEEE